ncbi:MAG TPA: glycerate kinase [Acidothermaceae bacterium]
MNVWPAARQRVLVAPDSFGGSMSAGEAADAIAAGWREASTTDTVTTVPLSDGGPGFVDVLAAGLQGRLVEVEVGDPLGRSTRGAVLVVDSGGRRTAYVESAQACGLHLLRPPERDPSRTTSAGVAALLRAALSAGADRIVVGLGGSGTSDAGSGMIESLAADAEGMRGVDLVVATDVDNPLLGPLGATAVFAAQKGATPDMMPVLEERLARFADLLGPELAQVPGAGAAGGLGFALFALGGHRESGADLVLRELDVAGLIAASDLVVTGEGSLDGQSLRGKLPVRVAAGCLDAAVPCVAIAGRVMLGRREVAATGFAGAYSIEVYAGSLEAAIALGAPGLRGLAAQVAPLWRLGVPSSGGL